ncbi:MAG: hypothetical protein AAF391_04380, partial [Bacteroidota bacterium]
MKRKHLLLISSLIFFSFIVREKSAQQLVRTIIEYFSERPMERVFVHHDKPFYAAGDELWYAAYVLNYNSNTSSSLSEILNIEIFNKMGTQVAKEKVQIANGFANGLIQLPDSLSPDYYLIKAYTNWSRNFEDGLFFNHYIKIVSPNYEGKSPASWRVQFFPEGGKILEKKLNTIAFKTNFNAATNAFLVDSQNDTIDELSYDGKGFGILKVVPKSEGERYFLLFEQDENRYPLPNVQGSGSLLRLQETQTAFRLFLENSNDLNEKEFSLLILNNGNIVTASDRLFSNNGMLLGLPKSDLPVGINHILIFDENQNILNQRLINNPVKELGSLNIETQKKWITGEMIDLEISSEYKELAQFSVS